jgi:excinuclease UvrABC nuclease subunit
MKIEEILNKEKFALPCYPDSPGIYVVTDSKDQLLYIGQSKQLCRRVSHLTAMQADKSNKEGLSHIKAGLLRDAQQSGKVFVRFYPTECEQQAKSLEKELLKSNQTTWNK